MLGLVNFQKLSPYADTVEKTARFVSIVHMTLRGRCRTFGVE